VTFVWWNMFRAYGSLPNGESTALTQGGNLPATWTQPAHHNVEMTARYEPFYSPATLDSANMLVENIFKTNQLKGNGEIY
jgi:hypothetical protein